MSLVHIKVMMKTIVTVMMMMMMKVMMTVTAMTVSIGFMGEPSECQTIITSLFF